MNKYDANTFGKRLRVMRRIQGYSQKQLAEIIGTKRIAVVNWEMGNTSITGKNLLLLAKALDVNPYWLYFGEY